MKYSDKLIIILTKECNRECPFCIDKPNRDYYKDNKPYIDLDTVKDILRFAEENNIKTIALNGGEPTLHPQIVEIAKMIKDKGFYTKIFTNFDFPEVIAQLDGIVDTIRISYYGPMQLPKQKDFKSKLTLKIMLTKSTFPTVEELEAFLQEYAHDFSEIQMHTLMQNNDYSINAQVDYLDYLSEHYPLKRNDKGDYYHDFMGFKIEREDLPNMDYDIEQRLYKAHIDGTISHYFEEDHYEIGGMDQSSPYTKMLRAHRNKKYRENVRKAYENGELVLDCDKYLPSKEQIALSDKNETVQERLRNLEKGFEQTQEIDGVDKADE